MTQGKNGDKSFIKLFAIIEIVANSKYGISGKEVAEQLSMPVSTAFRMLKFLVDNDYLNNKDSIYTLGVNFIRLGSIATEQNPLIETAHPFIQELSQNTMETVHLSIIKNNMVTYIDKVEGSRSVRMGSLIGNHSPIYCTGVGKAMFAFLEENKQQEILNTTVFFNFTPQTITSKSELMTQAVAIKEQGYAIDNCEHELGVFCIAAPIFNHNSRIIAAISISGSELYMRPNVDEFTKLIKETAKNISLACKYRVY